MNAREQQRAATSASSICREGAEASVAASMAGAPIRGRGVNPCSSSNMPAAAPLDAVLAALATGIRIVGRNSTKRDGPRSPTCVNLKTTGTVLYNLYPVPTVPSISTLLECILKPTAVTIVNTQQSTCTSLALAVVLASRHFRL